MKLNVATGAASLRRVRLIGPTALAISLLVSLGCSSGSSERDGDEKDDRFRLAPVAENAAYEITDMGTLPCGDRVCSSAAYGVNNQGEVVGGSLTLLSDGVNVTEHAVVWRGGKLTDLNGLGGNSSKARAINSQGQIVGDATLAGDRERHAFLWEPPSLSVGGLQLKGGIQDLGTIGCNSAGCHTSANGISNKGMIAGQGLVAGEAWHALANVEKDGKRQNVDLGIIDPPSERTPAPCSGPCNSIANGANSAGQVVGMSGGAPFHFEAGEEPNMEEGTPFDGVRGGAAFDIDESGTAVGEARIKPVEPGHNPPSHAYYGSTDLKTLAKDLDHAESRAYAVNDGTFGAPVVVGESRTDSGATHAFVWTDGRMRDLNNLIPANGGWVLHRAHGVNDRGWIVGIGSHNGVQRGFILTPGSSVCAPPEKSPDAPSIRAARFAAVTSAPCTVPIIFIPGVMGTELKCGKETIWPKVRPKLRRLALRSDGTTPVESCVKPGSIIKRFGIDIYESALNGLEGLPGVKIYPFPYDWRKRPGEAIPSLQQLIDKALSETKAQKVVIYAHSMGGLVARWYVDDAKRASRVDRVLTVGTPYLGSPKAWFPLSHGYSTPLGENKFDGLLSNGPLQELAQNLTGLYFLYPDRQYVKHRTWLYVRGNPRLSATLKEAGVLQAVSEYGGNKALLKSTWDARDRHLTGFSVHGVDYQLFVGLKMPTITEIVETHMGDGRPLYTGVQTALQDGDSTVPGFSAQAQADPRMVGPASVPIHYVCGVDHQALAGNAEVLTRSRDFLLEGKPIRPATGATCR